MSVADQVWIGADPGGKGNFGLAILESNGSAITYCVDCTDEAIQIVVKRVNSAPQALVLMPHYGGHLDVPATVRPISG
jgi:hypothetical protein